MSNHSQTKRMRMFAGPNGSGKSTIIREIQRDFSTGVYINADDIEGQLRSKGRVELHEYLVDASSFHFEGFVTNSTLTIKAKSVGLPIQLKYEHNIVYPTGEVNSYEAALIADFIRYKLIAKGVSFSFETVMSHPSKLEILRSARNAGFRNYLYFISTESPQINVDRVAARVQKMGHPVSSEKIIERYPKSMDLLFPMLTLCDRCFIFDNSLESGYRMIAEVENGTKLTIHTDDPLPHWVEKYLMQKLGL